MKNNQTELTELTFQTILESTPNAIVLVNKDGNIVYVNKQTEKLFGYDRTELIAQKVELLIPERYVKHHPEFRDLFFKMPTVRAMGAGRELFAIRKDATEFPIEIGLNPVVTANETLVLASIIDITERKIAEERFRLVVESAPNAMVLVNHKGDITLVNNQTEKLFGYERKELIGQKLEKLIPERFRAQHPEHRSHFLKNPQVRAMGVGRDLFALKKDATEVPVEIGLNPIDTPQGKMVLASIIDITERKRQELAIKTKQDELSIKNKELEQFTYIASHDLQEPLRTVANYVQVFKEDYLPQLDENAQAYLNAIQDATERMKMLVKALLGFSRLGRDKKLTYVNTKQLINEVIADLKTMINSEQATLEIGEMPQLYAYEIELRQLFQNLISNAIKFRKKNVAPHIIIRSEKKNKTWQFAITDNGIGIETKYFNKVFNIFQRLHFNEEYEGNGIGLANCKKIVELHQGKIWIESEFGQGTTFYFIIANITPHEHETTNHYAG